MSKMFPRWLYLDMEEADVDGIISVGWDPPVNKSRPMLGQRIILQKCKWGHIANNNSNRIY